MQDTKMVVTQATFTKLVNIRRRAALPALRFEKAHQDTDVTRARDLALSRDICARDCLSAL